jgi:hypothetical protein
MDNSPSPKEQKDGLKHVSTFQSLAEDTLLENEVTKREVIVVNKESHTGKEPESMILTE